MSFFGAIRKFFSPGTGTTPASRSFDPQAFIRVCQENPEEARALLAADQSALAREIEETFEAYDSHLEDLAARVHSLTPEQFKREAKTIREAQDGLRRALRRLEVSTKTAKELDRELATWEGREDNSAIHADHPAFRSEVIRSELRSRGVYKERRASEAPAAQRRPQNVKEVSRNVDALSAPADMTDNEGEKKQKENALLWLTQDAAELYAAKKASQFAKEEVREPHEPLTMPEVQYLLQAIKEATRETERWHGIPGESHDQEALLQVHHVRDLHAVLKRLDREQGISRNRIELAIHPRPMR